jgi:hypothetical protein
MNADLKAGSKEMKISVSAFIRVHLRLQKSYA